MLLFISSREEIVSRMTSSSVTSFNMVEYEHVVSNVSSSSAVDGRGGS